MHCQLKILIEKMVWIVKISIFKWQYTPVKLYQFDKHKGLQGIDF